MTIRNKVFKSFALHLELANEFQNLHSGCFILIQHLSFYKSGFHNEAHFQSLNKCRLLQHRLLNDASTESLILLSIGLFN